MQRARGLEFFATVKEIFERLQSPCFLRALCLNVARMGVSCGTALRPLLAAWRVDLVALSEADVNFDSGATWVTEWKAAG